MSVKNSPLTRQNDIIGGFGGVFQVTNRQGGENQISAYVYGEATKRQQPLKPRPNYSTLIALLRKENQQLRRQLAQQQAATTTKEK